MPRLVTAYSNPLVKYARDLRDKRHRRGSRQFLAEGLRIPAVSVSPENAPDHFGWMAMFVGLDMPASSAWTRETLGWRPTGPTLISDLQRMDYGAAAAA